MALQDREYYREGEAAAGAGALSSVVVKLIIVNVVVFLANLIFGDNRVYNTLAVHGDTIAHPAWWWQFLTAGFVHDYENLAHIGLNMLGLYVFGRPLEARFGWKEFLRFYLTAVILGNIAWSARNYFLVGPYEVQVGNKVFQDWGLAVGASGGVIATTILFCLLYPRATLLLFLVIPTPAWIAGIIIVALDVFAVDPPGMKGRVAHDVHLTGAAFALAYWGLRWNFGRLPGMAALGKGFGSLGRIFKPRPDLRLHDPEAVDEYEDLDSEADRILAKINREGQDSLTKRERRLLEAYSRRMRQKLR
jgi:membrane associated rhomboid family serine protease